MWEKRAKGRKPFTGVMRAMMILLFFSVLLYVLDESVSVLAVPLLTPLKIVTALIETDRKAADCFCY
jgi:hypothetical protein